MIRTRKCMLQPNPIVTDKRKIEPFNKDFYEQKPSISGTSDQEVSEHCNTLAIRVSGFDVPKPIKLFEDCGFPAPLMGAIAIQCQALPIVLSGRDIIGIAKTGSGKTAVFVLPVIVHIMDQPEQLDKGWKMMERVKGKFPFHLHKVSLISKLSLEIQYHP